jgi:phasin
MVAKSQTKPTPAAGFEMPKFDVPNFEVPKVEMPAAMRELAERSVGQAKEAYERMKTAAEQTTDLMEDTYATYSKGSVELTTKALEAAKSNTVAAFDFFRDVLTVKSVAELVEKQTAFVRQQFEAVTTQSKEIQGLAQKLATDTAAPFRAQAEKAIAEVRKTAA